MTAQPTQLLLPAPHHNRRWTTFALVMVMVLASMEATITSTAMPTIIGQLHGLAYYSWPISVYLLASTLTMPLYGWLADSLGRKRVLLSAMLLFSIGSLLASFSNSMLTLIIFRGIQGLGAGGIMPVVLTILGDIFTLQERAKVQGAFSAVWGIASFAGPALGSFLVTTDRFAPYFPEILRPFLGWPTIFWISLPLAALAAIVLIAKYEDHHHHHAAQANSNNAAQNHESKFKKYLQTLLSPPIFACILTSTLMGIAVIALDTWVPLYIQGARGMSAAAVGATITPVMCAWATSGIFAAPLLLRWSYRKLGVRGTLLGILGFAGLLVCAFTTASLPFIIAALFIVGLGFGPVSMATLLAAQNAVSYNQRGIVTAAITFTRNFGGAMGIAILGELFNALTAKPLADLHLPFKVNELLDPHLLSENQKAYPDDLLRAQATLSHALLFVFSAMLAFALLQLLTAAKLPDSHKQSPATTADALEATVA